MAIWSAEIKELERLNVSLIGHFPELEKEMGQLVKTEDENVALLYSRRCLEIIVTDLCECELKRPRKTEPLKGIIDKLNKEEKVASYIVTSMHSLNSLSSYGAHPKDFDPEQVKPAISNLAIILKWYLKYKGIEILSKSSKAEEDVIAGIGKQALEAAKLEKSVAILPFKNDSKDEENTYFINGLMEEILNNLQKIKDIRVISRTSVEQYRNQTKSIPEIAKELGVNYIVEGSGQKYGNSFRLRTQLILAAKETHLWGESFQQKITDVEDIFNIQTKIAEIIADELKAIITPEEKQLIEKVPTSNNEAYEAYLKGKFYLQNINQNNLDISQKYFELAKEKDPAYAYAYTGIAYIWLIRQQMGFTIPEEAGPKVMEAILKAAELDSNIAEVHFIQACINYLGVWDWKTSESEFLKAIEINPNHAEAHGLYAQLLYILGRPREAIKHSELSFKLDPLNQLVKMWYGFNFLYEKRYDDTISIYREVLKLDPNNYPFYSGISEASHLKGQLEEALESTKLYYINWYPDIDHVFDHYTKLGYSGVMNLEGDLLVKQSEKKYVMPADIVLLYGMGGNKEKTLEWLEKGYELRDPTTPYIGRPFFTSLLLNEPRYQELLSKLNIPYYD
jgi:TolB-like protein/tetratricopeptide (TPR) repeat protein